MRLNGVQEVVGSNPASPSLDFFEGLIQSEEVPEGWRGRWVFQRATASLPTEGVCDDFVLYFFCLAEECRTGG